ncbi:MAG: ATP-binding protein [Planctomycetaceae bacterium]|nr:ATP-binding protein [Planctomycetaceae bacterium]
MTEQTKSRQHADEFSARVDQLYQKQTHQLWSGTDRMFVWLMGIQLVAGVLTAVTLSPKTWIGGTAHMHIHIWAAVFLGTMLSLFPSVLAILLPGETITRHIVAVSQMLWSALFIHLSGGRIETHFHVFGSLAFLAFYRDWKVLVTATCVVAADHFARGVWWPQSVFGVIVESPYRWMEHAAWVVFEDMVLVYGCFTGTRQLRENCRNRVQLELTNERIESEISRRTRQLELANRELETSRTFVESTLDALTARVGILNDQFEVIELNANWRDTHDENPFASSRCVVGTDYLAFCRQSGGESFEAIVAAIQQLHSGDIDCWSGEYQFAGDDGGTTWCTIDVTKFHVGDELKIVLSHDDISEVKNLQGQLVHAQKLEAVGQLAAGVAHEINTPIQYIGDNARFLKDSAADLLDVLSSAIELVDRAAAGPVSDEEIAAIKEKIEAADVEYLEEEIPSAIEHSIDGANRVASIVRAMKAFSHPGQEGKSQVNLNEALESTITVATNEWKYVASVTREFDDSLLPTQCLPGEVNQVLLNLLVNAAHAIGDVVGDSSEKGDITIATRQLEDSAEIRISDTGTGIPEHARERIFDPFFTTKEVGKGTGQGLAIAHSIIAERHGGTIGFETEMGQGTTFIIRLPQDGREVT